VEAFVTTVPPVVFDVIETTQVGAARRESQRLAGLAGFDATDSGRVALVVTELGNNLWRHARGGQLLLRVVTDPRGLGVEVIAVDHGPGMAHVARCMADGYSSGTTPGTGLGAVRRAATECDVHSAAPAGTVLAVRVFASQRQLPRPSADVTWGAVSVPMRGETVCGDAFAVVERNGETSFLVADGLGHGPFAAAAAQKAVEVLQAEHGAGPAHVLERAHAALRGTRGAAVAVGTVVRATGAMRYAGVGNVCARLLGAGQTRSLVSLNGTVGMQMPRLRELDYVWPPGGLLVVHSDGLQSRWDLAHHLGLAQRDPAVVAGALFRDYSRGTDDVTVLAGRLRQPESRLA
jgi:anti-sigma regulatory factor (Ser/Thr protein kinase)